MEKDDIYLINPWRYLFTLILVGIFILSSPLAVFGFNNAGNIPPSSTIDDSKLENPENHSTYTSSPTEPIEVNLSLSQPPKLGEIADLTFTATIHGPLPDIISETKENNARAWVEFSYTNINGSHLIRNVITDHR